MSLRIGVKLSQDHPIEDFLDIWRTADEAGFDHVWVMDHIASVGEDLDRRIFDAWAMQAAMATTTSRIRLGCMVTGNTYRHPGTLAKLATTVDHLSGGRLEFGIGAGWAETEHRMYGLELGTLTERFDRFTEALQILRSLWTEPRTSFDGRFYQLDEAIAEPKPVQQPHPPIWIGGNGPKRTLRLVAQYADAWNHLAGRTVAGDGGTADDFVRLCGILDQHCAEIGRDPAQVRRTVQYRMKESISEVTETVERYAAAGASEFVIALPWRGDVHAALEGLAEALPDLRALG